MAASNVATIPNDRPSWAGDLDHREYAWVCSYLVHFNAKRAAVDASYPERSAHSRGYEIKNRPKVRAAIHMALRDAMPAIKMTIAERLAAIVTTDISEVVDWGEKRVRLPATKRRAATYVNVPQLKVKPAKDLSTTARAAVKSIKRRVGLYGDTVEVAMHDPVLAAERLQNLLELTKEVPGGGGSVTFIIEAPDGTVIRDVTLMRPVIDSTAVDAALAEDRDNGPEELPPGAKLVIERPDDA